METLGRVISSKCMPESSKNASSRKAKSERIFDTSGERPVSGSHDASACRTPFASPVFPFLPASAASTLSASMDQEPYYAATKGSLLIRANASSCASASASVTALALQDGSTQALVTKAAVPTTGTKVGLPVDFSSLRSKFAANGASNTTVNVSLLLQCAGQPARTVVR